MAYQYLPSDLAQLQSDEEAQRRRQQQAQMLMQAEVAAEPAPAQIRVLAERGQSLALAMPVLSDDRPVAYAYLALPASVLVDVLDKEVRGGARIDLRQGDGIGDVLIASRGESKGSSGGDLGTPIAGSRLWAG